MPRYIENRETYPDGLFFDLPKKDDYDIKVKPLPYSPAEPEQFYWHLFFKGDKVNGGLCTSEGEAMNRASQYKYDHHRVLFLEKYVFDQETAGWIPRSSLNI
jgi:hypothetical protein